MRSSFTSMVIILICTKKAKSKFPLKAESDKLKKNQKQLVEDAKNLKALKSMVSAITDENSKLKQEKLMAQKELDLTRTLKMENERLIKAAEKSADTLYLLQALQAENERLMNTSKGSDIKRKFRTQTSE
jgi:hypothetical protein